MKHFSIGQRNAYWVGIFGRSVDGRRISLRNPELYLSVPRAASFAVTLRLGKSTQLLQLPGRTILSANTMKKQLLDGITMINYGDMDALQKAIPDDSYRVNFIGLVERLSPDGDNIKTVGFTAGSDQEKRIVALATPKKELRERIPKTTRTELHEPEAEHVEIQQNPLEADAKKLKRRYN